MKQVIQSLRSGQIELVDLPIPSVAKGQLLVRSLRTLISAGTERTLIEFGKSGWLERARNHPDRVREVLDRISTDGLFSTIEAITRRLDTPVALGYCNAGVVVGIGDGVSGISVGDRVVSNGAHAEMVLVPQNLCARVPDSVSDDEAAFTVLGAVALQGVRLASPTLGENVVVIGLGLIGLLTVQLLRAHGCRVLGMDIDRTRLELAEKFGATVADLSAGVNPLLAASTFTRSRGVDAVIITASTNSNDPVHHAAQMCRKRGRIVLVGVSGLELSRADFYEKELTFQVSCSYGPGRYDSDYESKGQDYPIGFVRWTAQRNFEAILDMIADRRIDVAGLITHRFDFDSAERAYEIVGSSSPSIGILLEYQNPLPEVRQKRLIAVVAPTGQRNGDVAGALGASAIGAGQYAGAILLPAFQAAGVRMRFVVSSGGASSARLGRKFGFKYATTDATALLADRDTDIVVIGTRHDSHARFVVSALAAGKHVFVEKPLAMSAIEVDLIAKALDEAPNQLLMVGFNRRFAPQVRRMKSLLQQTPGPKAFVMTVNAGSLPQSHWAHDREIGGGRLLGEGCHFVDLLRFLAGSPIRSHSTFLMASEAPDNASVTLKFVDGSLGTIHYFANGSKAFPKERLEVFVDGRVLQLDNFRRLTGFGWRGFKKQTLWRQDKGHRDCVRAFVDSVRSGAQSPISRAELLEVADVCIAIGESAR